MIPTTYTTDYEIAVAILFRHEGGYVNLASDSGGVTNMGITQASFADYCKRKQHGWTLPTLTKDQAREFYFDEYWLPLRLPEVENQGIKNVLLSTAVNVGRHMAVQRMQNLVGAETDGKIGPITIAMINHYVDPDFLISSYCESILEYYTSLVKFSKKNQVFYRGWKKRINSFLPIGVRYGEKNCV